MLGLWALGFIAARMNTSHKPPESTPKPTDSDSDEHDESRDAEDAKPSWRTRMAERFKPKNKVRLALFIGVAIFVGQWAWKEFGDKLTHANVGPGMMTYDGNQILVKRLAPGEDVTKLPRFETPGQGEPLSFSFNPRRADLYVVVLEKNDRGEIMPALGHQPVLYTGQKLTRCAVQMYALYLGPKSKIKEMNITAVVDTDSKKRCDPLSGLAKRR